MTVTRRRLLQTLAASLAVGAAPVALGAGNESAPKGKGCTFSFGTYGMKTLKVEDAIKIVADTGYDGIEIIRGEIEVFEEAQ